jgi:uncharacterized damage-inducible protein DinB
MAGRPHKDRLLAQLNDIRKELVEEVTRFKPEEFDWVPHPGMKSCKALLDEVARMEKVCVSYAANQSRPEWEKAASFSGNDVKSYLTELERIRSETVKYLDSCTEEKLQTPIPMPEAWQQYFGKTVEPEEMLRWVTRHEYYHLGQIINYRWISGDNPYKRQ